MTKLTKYDSGKQILPKLDMSVFSEWIESSNVTKTFRLKDEPELIHVIKTGFEDKYMVVHEDAYEINIGKVTYGTKMEIEDRFGITL